MFGARSEKIFLIRNSCSGARYECISTTATDFDLPVRDKGVGQGADLRLVQFLEDAAGWPDAFVYFECVAALDEGLGLHPGEIIVIAAIAATDERYVAKAARRQIADHRALAFEQRIRRDRCTKADRANLVGGAERLEASHHALDRILRRG